MLLLCRWPGQSILVFASGQPPVHSRTIVLVFQGAHSIRMHLFPSDKKLKYDRLDKEYLALCQGKVLAWEIQFQRLKRPYQDSFNSPFGFQHSGLGGLPMRPCSPSHASSIFASTKSTAHLQRRPRIGSDSHVPSLNQSLWPDALVLIG
jgi:hypothetical protein